MSEHRIFEFQDEKSRKLWSITLNDKSHTVWFGRAGTTGQTQVKDFPSAEAARLSYEKLVAEKVKKGYVEVDVKSWVVKSVFVDEPVSAQPTELLKQERTAANLESLQPERRIDLDPLDYLWVSGPPEKPWPRPQHAPFDRKACEARLEKIRQAPGAYWKWNWAKAKIADFLSPEEAQFWFLEIIKAQNANIQLPTGGELLSPKQVAEILAEANYHFSDEIIKVLSSLMSGIELFEVLFTLPRTTPTPWPAVTGLSAFSVHFRSLILPYMPRADILEIHTRLQSELSLSNWPKYRESPWSFLLAACIDGSREELKAVVEFWSNNYYKKFPRETNYHRPEEIIFGLRDKKQIIAHFKRLSLKLTKPEYIRAWLALTEFEALEVISESILAHTDPIDPIGQEEAIQLTKTFGIAVAPEVAVQMLRITTEPKLAQPALQWLNDHPIETIVGLLPLVENRDCLTQNATNVLQSIVKRGYEPFVRSCLADLEQSVADRMSVKIFDMGGSNLPILDESTTPDWLYTALRTITKSKKVSDWVSPEDLPAVNITGYQLNLDQVKCLLLALRQSNLTEQESLVKALKEHGDPSSLDRFVWKLFERWLSIGAPSKESWAMTALGLLGGNTVALKLAPMIRVWPGELQHKRAVNGLECLRAIGTDTALMQINGIAQKVKFQGIKSHAQACIEGIASDRNLSRAQLEDRIVPDCGLDENGKRVFDFGTRQFQFVLGENLKPLVRDSDGKTKPDLPKPNSKDDQEQANQAIADWKLLKKQVAEVAKIQAVRLEQAMTTGRRWSGAEFLLFFIQHPLMNHIAQLLIWAEFDGNGKPTKTFRVSEDRTLADVNEEIFTLEGAAQVGVVHPLLLTETELSAWGEVVSDYCIFPPFPQLDRPVYALEPAEHTAVEITRFKNIDIPIIALVRTLEHLGWEKASFHDAGTYRNHHKYFPADNIVAVVGEYKRVIVDARLMDDSDYEKIDRCYFEKRHPVDTPVGSTWVGQVYKHKILPLDQVPALIISEVLKDLYTVSSKVS